MSGCCCASPQCLGNKQVWEKSGKKGVYPLLFVDDKFIADVCFDVFFPARLSLLHHCSCCCAQFDEMRDLNEEGQLKGIIV